MLSCVFKCSEGKIEHPVKGITIRELGPGVDWRNQRMCALFGKSTRLTIKNNYTH